MLEYLIKELLFKSMTTLEWLLFETVWLHSSLPSFLDSCMKEEKVIVFRKKVFTLHDTWQECHNILCLKIHPCNEVITYAIPPKIKVHLCEHDRHTLRGDLYKIKLQFQ